ncbi:hypothetical protein [Methylocella sp.]|uniref:hypothetical protein n=1 Tax=Methylocella sp. TaxID=1978226 RepID=UPI0035B22768
MGEVIAWRPAREGSRAARPGRPGDVLLFTGVWREHVAQAPAAGAGQTRPACPAANRGVGEERAATSDK